jgi:cell division septal protein FtsQ
MTQDEVLKMARRAGYFIYDLTETHKKKTVETDEADEWAQLERFAKLVAQHEREQCIKAIEDQIAWDLDDPESTAIKAIKKKSGV